MHSCFDVWKLHNLVSKRIRINEIRLKIALVEIYFLCFCGISLHTASRQIIKAYPTVSFNMYVLVLDLHAQTGSNACYTNFYCVRIDR